MAEKEEKNEGSIYDQRGILRAGDSLPKEKGGDYANPIKSIFLGIVAGVAEYLNIYPKNFCPRCGHRSHKQKDGTSACPNCGMIVNQERR
jgi:NADH pyrophosphatase NudC (nudix superfamily)